MPSPFPGMDPYLEAAEEWPSFHAALIAEIGNQLNSVLRPKYIARIEKRIYITDRDDPAVPDVAIYRARRSPRNGARAAVLERGESIPVTIRLELEVEEWSLKILRAGSRAIVTVIELVSPSNKLPGSTARRSYLAKQRETLASDTNWVELDLLREGRSTIPLDRRADAPYSAFVSRAVDRPQSRLWPIRLEEPLPALPVPLEGNSEAAIVDLQIAFDKVYNANNYDLELDYSVDPVPPLAPAQAKWAKKLLKKRR